MNATKPKVLVEAKKTKTKRTRVNGSRDQSERRISVLLKSIARLQNEVADLKRVEKDLRLSEERLMLVSTGNGEGIWDYNFATGDLYFSPTVGDLLQYGDEPLPSTLEQVEALISPEDLDVVKTKVKEHWAKRSPVCTVEYRIKTRKQKFIWVRSRATTVWQRGGKPLRMVGVLTDISKERELQEQFRQSQKMEAVGQFAGGIAHDFNNILGIVLGYSDLLIRKMAKDDPARPKIEAIRSAGQKAAQITKQLLAFSRRQLLQPQVIDLNTHLIESSQMIRCLLPDNVEVKTSFTDKESFLKLDPTCLEQIVVNLVINGRDAMPKGGTLTLRTFVQDFQDSETEPHGVAPGKYIGLDVIDTGCGISKEVLSRIFEPFFTTKATGKGTGLGLSTVYGIVKQNAGFINVTSQVGKGTQVRVCFPQSVDRKVSATARDQSEEPPKGHETVLIVEDEDWLRSLAYEILTNQGYTVFEVRNGDEALQLCAHKSTKVDLVFTDVVMPKRDGMGLWERLRKIRPEVKFLFTSGYPSKHASFIDGAAEKDLFFINKPYDLLSLSKKVREVLDQPVVNQY